MVHAEHTFVAWGGVGCKYSIVELAHVVDATQQGWWGGVGCNSIAELARMVDATQQGVGWGAVASLNLRWGGVE